MVWCTELKLRDIGIQNIPIKPEIYFCQLRCYSIVAHYIKINLHLAKNLFHHKY